MKFESILLLPAVFAVSGLLAEPVQPGLSPGPGVRYATDAYPGFDSEDEIVKPSKKTPGWFRWWSGPKMDTAAEQLAWAGELEAAGKLWRAARAYDSLVGKWPAAPEAPIAQLKLAELYERDDDAISACEEYRYLLDFFSSKCDYAKIVDADYAMCEKMREQGKRIIFFRFANTVDVRRAYEALVLRSPGAAFVPDAMLTIAQLREDEGKYQLAVVVYENLRNLHPKTLQARTATHREAKVRMLLMDEHGYNRDRIRDTINFLQLAIRSDCTVDERNDYVAWLEEARKALDSATYIGNRFYDSRTRTRRSAINAYRLYLEDYPDGEHAEAARERLAELEAMPEPPPPEEKSPAKEKSKASAPAKDAKPQYVFDPEAPYSDPQAVKDESGEPVWLTDYMAEREAREEAERKRAEDAEKRKWYYLWLAR